MLAGTVGLRWGECVGIRVGDIDFLRRRIRVEQTVEEVSGHVRVAAATKSEAGKRSFALPAFLVDELAAHLAAHRQGFTSDDLVFLGPKDGILRRSFEARVFKPAVEAAGLPENLTFHGLRHVATTLMIANNEHPKIIQHRLGHRSGDVPRRLRPRPRRPRPGRRRPAPSVVHRRRSTDHGTVEPVTAPRLVTIEEMEMMSPEERVQLLKERTITDLSQVDPAFLERAKADARRALEKRQALDQQR